MAKRKMSGEGSVYQRKSDGRWVAVVRVPGQPSATLYAPTKTAVLAKRKDAERRLEQGLPATDKTVTVQVLCDEWLEAVRLRKSAGTLKAYRTVVNCRIVPHVGTWKVSALQPKDVDRLTALAADAGLSNSTVRQVRMVMQMLLRFGITRHYCSRNVAAETEPVPEEHREGRTLTPEQAKKLLAAFESERFGAAFTVMLGCGTRLQETLNLVWRDIDLERGSLTVHGKTKTRASIRTIDLPAFVLDALRAHRDAHPGIGDALVFPNTVGKPQDPKLVYSHFVRCVTATLGEHWHPHELRHTAASLMLASGVPLEVVSKVLGHSTVSVTADVYSHFLPAAYQDAAVKMDAMLGEVSR